MYYNLTKNEYKKYEREFKQTYVGSQYFITRIIFGCGEIFLFVWLIFDIFPNFINNMNQGGFEIAIFPGILILSLAYEIGVILWHIEYRRELKNYIIEKTKNK